MKYLIYHENNQTHPFLPQEDMYAHDVTNGVFIVADGVTLDTDKSDIYPLPSDAAEVSRLICNEVVGFLAGKEFSSDTILQAYKTANAKVKEFNVTRPLFMDRENNGYTFGAAVTAIGWIKDNKLIYGVLDDCYISVFSYDLTDHPTLKGYVDASAKYIDTGMDWNDPNVRKIWRKELRNHVVVKDGITYGYGALDGSDGFEQFLQLGEVNLKPNDLVCVYTDGFIKALADKDFVKFLYSAPFTGTTVQNLSDKLKALAQTKEKTAYFIRI